MSDDLKKVQGSFPDCRRRGCFGTARKPRVPLQTALAAELEHLEYIEMKRNALDADIKRGGQKLLFRAYVEVL